MTNPSPPPARPTNEIVAPPAPQGTVASRKLRVVVFNTSSNECHRLNRSCLASGCDVTEVRVVSPNDARLINIIRNDTYLSTPEGKTTRGVCTAENAAKIIAELNPDIVCRAAIKREDVSLETLIDYEIPKIVPPNVEHLVDTVSGYIINAKDGRDGDLIRERAINVANFLAAKAQKIAAKEGQWPG